LLPGFYEPQIDEVKATGRSQNENGQQFGLTTHKSNVLTNRPPNLFPLHLNRIRPLPRTNLPIPIISVGRVAFNPMAESVDQIKRPRSFRRLADGMGFFPFGA
jgi:hypothetical protein